MEAKRFAASRSVAGEWIIDRVDGNWARVNGRTRFCDAKAQRTRLLSSCRLVLESFITPSVFDATGNEKIVDEWTFGSLQSKTQAKAILQKHLNTFVTEDDFRQIAALGLNHVRIPSKSPLPLPQLCLSIMLMNVIVAFAFAFASRPT